MDNSDFEIIADFAKDIANVRFLEIKCDLSDDYIAGHARRIGLLNDQSPENTAHALIPTLRMDLNNENERIRQAGFKNFFQVEQGISKSRFTAVMADYLEVDSDAVTPIVEHDHLFSD